VHNIMKQYEPMEMFSPQLAQPVVSIGWFDFQLKKCRQCRVHRERLLKLMFSTFPIKGRYPLL
jgi:hypothetical protein